MLLLFCPVLELRCLTIDNCSTVKPLVLFSFSFDFSFSFIFIFWSKDVWHLPSVQRLLTSLPPTMPPLLPRPWLEQTLFLQLLHLHCQVLWCKINKDVSGCGCSVIKYLLHLFVYYVSCVYCGSFPELHYWCFSDLEWLCSHCGVELNEIKGWRCEVQTYTGAWLHKELMT